MYPLNTLGSALRYGGRLRCRAGLSITSVGRRLPGPTTLKHKIKRADRLIGNPHLYGERTAIYGALCRATLARIAEPLLDE